jgi:hypothetical protein
MAADRDYEGRFEAQLASSDVAGALATARAAFRDEAADEHTLAWLAGNIYERDLRDGFSLIENFVQRYPASLHIMRVFLADLHARNSDFDRATHEARAYLRQVHDTGVLRDGQPSSVIRDGLARAFMLLTAAYTEAGARSYSMRALQAALCLPISDSWRHRIKSEVDNLQRERREPAHSERDHAWEEFFAGGRNADELSAHCAQHGFELLARRIDLIAAHFRFDSDYCVDESEVLQVECRSEDDVLCLA